MRDSALVEKGGGGGPVVVEVGLSGNASKSMVAKVQLSHVTSINFNRSSEYY
jgi:hypothetical protein